MWPSVYFTHLHTALVATGSSEDVIESLPAYAECCLHYARAMTEARKMPAELKADPEAAYVTFESEARLFTAKWQRLGFSLKAYGYHLWANLPTLMRKWGSLEGMCQSSVEGTIGKLARILPHLQLKPGGKYSNDILNAPNPTEAKLEELMRRRAMLESPAVDEFNLEHLEVEYGLTLKDKSRMPMREILLKIDDAITAGKVVPYTKYNVYWQRYMAVTKLKATMQSWSQCSRATAISDTRYADLKTEVSEYYSPAVHQYPVTSGKTNDEWAAWARGTRKARWRASGMVRGRGQRFEASGQLAYQSTAKIAAAGPPARLYWVARRRNSNSI